MPLSLRKQCGQRQTIGGSPKVIGTTNFLEKSDIEVEQSIEQDLELSPLVEESGMPEGNQHEGEPTADKTPEVTANGCVNSDTDWDYYCPKEKGGRW